MDWKHWLNRAVEEVAKGHPQFHLISTDDGRVPEIDSEIGERHPIIFRVNIQEEYFQPYYPFLSWAKSLLSEDINPELFLEEAKIYYFQRPIFQNYLWGTKLEREEILPYEERWEEDQFHQSLWNLLIHLLNGRVGIFVIENAQELGRSTLKALLNWRKKNLNGRVILILVQRQNHEPAEREHVSFWEDFVETWGVWKQLSQATVTSSGQKKIRRYSLRDLQASVTHLGHLLDFFCLEEADELANRLYIFYQRHPRSFPEELLSKLLEYLGWCNYFQDRILQSLSVWAHQLSLVSNRQWMERSRLTRYLAQCFLKLREDQKASALAYRALELAQQSQNQVSIFYAMHVVLWSELNFPTMSPEQWKKEFRRFLEMGQELDRVNALAFWLVNPYLMDSVEQVSEATYYQQWGIELCEKYQNYFLLSYGFLNIGYFWSIKGEYEKVLESYQKSEELKIRIGRHEELPQVYNSRGYFLMNIGNYIEAQENFSKALSGLYHYRSIVEIGLTLFNLAINAFRAEHWERAERDFQRLYTFLRNLDLQRIIFHGKREVLIYLGLCQIQQNKLTKAFETWLKLAHEPPNDANWDEQLSFLIFKAHIQYYETGKESLLTVFQEAENYLLKHKVDLRFLVPWFYLYFGQLFDKAGLESQAVQYWKKGYMESFQLPNVKIRQRLQDRLNGIREDGEPIPLPDPTRETVEWIIDTAREFKYVREVQKNKATIDILMNFQELLSALASNEEIIYDTMRVIERGFLFDGLSLFEVITGNQRIIYQSPSLDEETMEVIKQILPTFKNQGGLLLIPDIDQDPWNFKDIHPHFGLIFVSGDFLGEYQLYFAARFALQFHYSPHEERVLQLMISQLANLIGRRRREKNLFDENLLLRKLVYKDSLTGILNRRGILEKIQEEVSRLLRYKKGTCSLLVMEILNIHAINHDLGYVGGDGILKSIATYLDRMVRTVDIVGRIGGSLFCLILPETGKEGSKRLIERINQRLEDFVIDVNVHENKIKLELCFGGAEWRQVDEDLLERANNALKYAKQNGLTYFFHGEDV
jgi:diguanylate cyclase (GGDEF)-like protein